MIWGLTAYALGVLALTYAEVRDTGAKLWLKPLLAAGFVAMAVFTVYKPAFGDAANTIGASGRYGLFIIAALVACALGDVLLLRRGTGPAFLLGMGAFAVGHLLYSYAFALLAMSAALIGGAVIMISILAAGLMARAQPPALRWGTTAYGGIIGLMLATAYGTGSWLLAPAIAFATSDIFVGLNRFHAPQWWHPIAITPLYFGAQAAFALSPALLA